MDSYPWMAAVLLAAAASAAVLGEDRPPLDQTAEHERQLLESLREHGRLYERFGPPLPVHPRPDWVPLLPPSFSTDRLAPWPTDPVPSPYYEVRIPKRWVWLATGLAVIFILTELLDWVFPRRTPAAPPS